MNDNHPSYDRTHAMFQWHLHIRIRRECGVKKKTRSQERWIQYTNNGNTLIKPSIPFLLLLYWAAILENSNGDISAADHPIYSVFGCRMGFSGSADRMALIPV